jgi:hypothetical protein
MDRIDIKGDGTLVYSWVGDKERGSLFGIMAKSNVELANQLSEMELWSVYMCSQCAPFPLGGGETYYRATLAKFLDNGGGDFFKNGKLPRDLFRSEDEKKQLGFFKEDPPLTGRSLGRLRLHLVQRAGSGINAPTDSYLNIAADIACSGEVKYNHQY